MNLKKDPGRPAAVRWMEANSLRGDGNKEKIKDKRSMGNKTINWPLEQPIVFLKNFLNKGHSRSANAKKNILTSFLIKGCNITISLVLVPLTIHYVKPTQYGIWLTLSSIIG